MRGFDSLHNQLNPFFEKPILIFKGPFRIILLSVIPFGLMNSFPAKLFVEGFSAPVFFQILVVTAIFFIGVLAFWNKGLKNYSSASS